MGKSRCWGELLEVVHGLIVCRLRGGIRKVGRVMGGLFKVIVVVADQWELLFTRPLEILRQNPQMSTGSAAGVTGVAHLRVVTLHLGGYAVAMGELWENRGRTRKRKKGRKSMKHEMRDKMH